MKLESLTMKLYSSLISNSDGIFSVSFSVHPPFASRSLLVRFSIGSRSVLDRFSFILRSSSVHSSFGNRRSIEDWSKNERRIIGGKTDMYRNPNGKPRERRPEQELYFLSLNSNYYGKTYSWIHHFSAPLYSAYWKSMSYVKLMGGFGWRIDEVRNTYNNAMNCFMILKD